MKSINEYISDIQYLDVITEEFCIVEGLDMINESFKSSILSKLAKVIFDAEKYHNMHEIEDKKKRKIRDKERGYEYPDDMYKPTLNSFASIFGPKTVEGRYGGKKTGVQGVKWSEIEDKDFKEYTEYSKELNKLIKSSYGKKDGNADFIIEDPDGKIINFIKAYGESEKSAGMFYFNIEGKWEDGVKEFEKDLYKYNKRSLKVHEVIEAVKGLIGAGCKVYALEITPDMIKDYDDLHIGREKSQKGVINYDKKSLDALLKNQKSRYNALVKDMKAKRLEANKDNLFDEIKKVNDEVVALYQKVMSKPEYIDKFYDLGRLMIYTSNAYEQFYKYTKSMRDSDKRMQRAKERAAERGEEFDAKEYDKYDYDKSNAKSSIRDCEEYINNVKKEIERVNKALEGKDED